MHTILLIAAVDLEAVPRESIEDEPPVCYSITCAMLGSHQAHMSEWWYMKAWTVREYTGFGLIALSGVVTAALMTWSVQDPNFSYAPSGPIHNVIGYPGAIGADLLTQTLDLGSITLILPIAVWGWRMVSHRDFDRESLRFGCWMLCVAIATGFASCWPRNPEWPLPTGFGGVVGDALVGVPIVVFGSLGRIVLGIILGAVMIATFMVASGAGSRAPEESSWF